MTWAFLDTYNFYSTFLADEYFAKYTKKYIWAFPKN
jgi:hypothetical protein